LLPAGERR
jgi:hypothetical protein